MIDLLKYLFQLVVMIFGEYKKISDAAEKANAKFQVDQHGFLLMVEVSVQKLRDNAPKDSAGAGDAWDSADRDLPQQNK